MTQPYKVCPRCQTPAALDAPQCSQCGRQYRTQFVPPDQTQAFAGNPALPIALPTVQSRKGVRVAIAIILVVLVGCVGWNLFKAVGIRDVVAYNASYMFPRFPMATREAADLSLWEMTMGGRAFQQPEGNETMIGSGRIVMLEPRTDARLLWERNNIAQIRVLSGPMKGTEGAISSRFLYTATADGSPGEPLHPSLQPRDPFKEDDAPASSRDSVPRGLDTDSGSPGSGG